MAKNDRLSVKTNAEKLFGEIKVLGRNGEQEQELAFITPFASERELDKLLGKLKDCEIISTMRLI